MSTYSYATEQIGKAVQELATKEGSLRERMKEAFIAQASAPIQDLPADTKKSLETLRKDMKSEQTIESLSSEELARLADRTLALWRTLLRQYDEHS